MSGRGGIYSAQTKELDECARKKEAAEKTEATRICPRGKNSNQHGKWTARPNHCQPEPRLDERGEAESGKNKKPYREKIHISAAQETHTAKDRSYPLDDYRITIVEAAKGETTGVAQGGTAVTKHERPRQYIYIDLPQRKRSAVLRVTMRRGNSKMETHTLSTYSPRNEHAEEERRWSRKSAKEIPNKTCKRHVVIWIADENGHLGRDEEENATQANASTEIIGPYARSKRKRGW